MIEKQTDEEEIKDYNYILINENVYLSKMQETDAPYIVKYLNDIRVYSTLIGPPTPYKDSDAKEYLKKFVIQMKMLFVLK